jgi:hypothetical protein
LRARALPVCVIGGDGSRELIVMTAMVFHSPGRRNRLSRTGGAATGSEPHAVGVRGPSSYAHMNVLLGKTPRCRDVTVAPDQAD